MPPNNPYEAPTAATNVTPAHVRIAKVRSVAMAQRMVNIAILAYLLLIAVNIASQNVARDDPNSILPVIALAIILGLFGFIIFAVARMGYVMHGVVHAIIYAVAMMVPCLGLILLLILNSRVTDYLSRNGVKVGLMGADKTTIP